MADRPVDSVLQKEKGDVLTPKKGKKKLVLLGSILLFVMIIIGSVIFFAPGFLPEKLRIIGDKGPSEEVKKNVLRTQGHIYSMDPIVVNLADAELPRYLKIKIDIESVEQKPNEEHEKRILQFRDAILTILSSKTYKEIYDADGKEMLREEIIQKANQLFDPFKVKTIYFGEFVVQ